tara:strand:+ start:395 stop:1144 length:750 start_codon:yes stop_codon:yes gene_type:complete
MSNELQFDGSVPTEQAEAQAADEASSLEIGEQLAQAENQLLAGKYKSAQELEQGYLELQKMVGQNQSQPEQVEQTAPTVSDKLAEAFDSYSSQKNFDASAFEDVSKEDLIKAFFENSEEVPTTNTQTPDLSETQITSMFDRVGGKESYEQMMNWAVQNMPKEEIETFDAIVDQGNPTTIAMAIDAMQKRFIDVNGQDGNLIQGKAAFTNNSYRSQAELLRDMNDPRYEDDPAYRNDVMTKLANSPDVQF